MEAAKIEKYATHNRVPFFQIAKDFYTPGMKILDIGAGDGAFARYIGDENIHLIEGNEESFKALKTDYPQTFHLRLPAALPFSDKDFDLIHCSHIIEHLNASELYSFLHDVDRVLASGGYFVVSAPLLWDGFYNDLSHIKPYSPTVFLKYMAGKEDASMGSSLISSDYQQIRLQYRYRFVPIKNIHYQTDSRWKKFFFDKVNSVIADNQMGTYTKTGFTLVLKKG